MYCGGIELATNSRDRVLIACRPGTCPGRPPTLRPCCSADPALDEQLTSRGNRPCRSRVDVAGRQARLGSAALRNPVGPRPRVPYRTGVTAPDPVDRAAPGDLRAERPLIASAPEVGVDRSRDDPAVAGLRRLGQGDHHRDEGSPIISASRWPPSGAGSAGEFSRPSGPPSRTASGRQKPRPRTRAAEYRAEQRDTTRTPSRTPVRQEALFPTPPRRSPARPPRRSA